MEFEHAGHRREGDRAPVNLECQVRVGTRAWQRTRLADLTPGGFQVRILDMPPRGTALFIRIPGLQMLNARVCWTRQGTAGCQFDSPLSGYIYEHILHQARA